MIHILLVSGNDGTLKSFSASGHAEAAERGFDIVCSAVTSLLRTAILSLQSIEKQLGGLIISVQAEKRGNLNAEIKYSAPDYISILAYLFDFLVIGLKSIEDEYPNCVELKIK